MCASSRRKPVAKTEILLDDIAARSPEQAIPISATKHHSVVSTGLILLDRTGQCLYINSTAQQVLCYPAPLRNDQDLIRQQIHSRLLPVCSRCERGTLVSGRRTYIYQTRLLESVNAPEGATIAIVLERNSRRNENVRRICERYKLTPREREALMLLAEGLTSKEIAQRMDISAHTVKGFVHLVMLKLGVTTRSGIVGKINRS
jgi:DNA-binding CsgD family transcriptional regulator